MSEDYQDWHLEPHPQPTASGPPARGVQRRGGFGLYLAKLDRLSPLSPAERRALAEAVSRVVTVGADQDIVREGETPSDYRVLLDGIGARYKLLPDGKRQIVAFGLPGDGLDLEVAARGGGRMEHAVAALCPCTLAVIPHQALRALAEEHPGIVRALWRETLLAAAITREWVVNVGRRSADERIAHLFCETHARLDAMGLAGDDPDERSFAWPVTQAELADATGLSTVHVNRTLQRLRGAGLITLRGDTLHIRSWTGLAELGGFSADYLRPVL